MILYIYIMLCFLSLLRANNLSSAIRRDLQIAQLISGKCLQGQRKVQITVCDYRLRIFRVALESFRFFPLWFLKKNKNKKEFTHYSVLFMFNNV